MIRTESERQFYLGTAGIRLWYARQPLPGAAPSPEFEFPDNLPEPEALLVTSEPVARRAVTPPKAVKAAVPEGGRQDGVTRIADLQALMQGERADSVQSARPAQPPGISLEALEEAPQPTAGETGEEAPAPESVGKVQKVNLRLWAGANIVLVADMSADTSNRLQETLALKILNSLGQHQARVLGSVCWPVFNNLLVPGNSESDLVEVMRSVVAGLDRHELVVLGVGSGAERDWLSEALGRDISVRFGHSLAELAGNGDLKRSLWRLLKPLAVRE